LSKDFNIAGAFQLKAQQKLSTVDSMLFKAPKNFNQFKLSDSSLFRNFNLPKQNQLMALSSLNKVDVQPFYSRMPVVKVSSNDKMPVARGANVDNMPIVKLKAVDPLAVAKPVNP
jgi:hypothetical protein